MALRDTFSEYLQLLASQRPTEPAAEPRVKLLINRGRVFRGIVERVEDGALFRRLARETRECFPGGAERLDDDWWVLFLQNVLRRSGIYVDVLTGVRIDEVLFHRFRGAVAPDDIATTTIAPLEYVEFSKPRLDFDGFHVRRFTPTELADLVENPVREVFFPDTVYDVALLSQYWWLVVTQTRHPSDSPHEPLTIVFPHPVTRRFSSFSSVLTNPLKCLVLYDWDSSLSPPSNPAERYSVDHHRNMAGWSGFTIPFTVTAGGSLRLSLQPPPDLAVLKMDPVYDSDGSEVGERPAQGTWLDAAETDSFQTEVAQFQRQLAQIGDGGKRWAFIDVATGYLVKAFFADELDQLLWHIATLEALFSEDADKLTETLARRCKRVLASTKEHRGIVADSFKCLYRLRSDTVHGNPETAKAHLGHLAVARYMARDCIVWFLSYLAFLAQVYKPGVEGYPKRTELVAAVDHEPGERARLLGLLSTLPGSFPSFPQPQSDGQQGNAEDGLQQGS